MPEEFINNEERIGQLLDKYFTQELSVDEGRELEAYCVEKPELRLVLQRLDNKEAVAGDMQRWNVAETEKHLKLTWAKFEAQQEARKAKFIGWSIASIAAVFIILYLRSVETSEINIDKGSGNPIVSSRKDIARGGNKATLTVTDGQQINLDTIGNGKIIKQGNTSITKSDSGSLVYITDRQQYTTAATITSYNMLTTPRAGQYKVTLPDGTKVSLNNASSLRYPIAFSGSTRTVEVTGEAYFQVAKDAKHPFIVYTNERTQKIEVLGTSFNICAYPGESRSRTTLITGMVKVTRAGRSEVLKPNEALVIMSNSWQHLTDIDADADIAWEKGMLHFTNASLEDVMHQLERWYDVTVKIQGTIPAHQFNNSILRSNTLEQTLNLLSAHSTIFTFNLDGNKILITR